MSRAMLLHADLSPLFWPFAISTAVYLKNRLPHLALPSGVTSYECWFYSKPDLSHLRSFSAHCFSRINTPNSKLQARGEAGRFLGYALESKAYIFWHTETQSVKIRRNLAFHGPPTARINHGGGGKLDLYQNSWNVPGTKASSCVQNDCLTS